LYDENIALKSHEKGVQYAINPVPLNVYLGAFGFA